MKKFEILFFTSLVLVIIANTLSFGAEALSDNYYSKPDAIIKEIKSRGAKAVVIELTRHWNVWDSICDNVATGDEAWLKAAAALQAGTDAGSSEMVYLALGEALEYSPERVFKIVANTFNLQFICGCPDVDNARYNSYELSMKAINLRIKKVTAVKDRSLGKTSEECIRYLEESKKSVAEFYQVKEK